AVHFAKLSAPWEPLLFYAEELSVRARGCRWKGAGQGCSSMELLRLRLRNPLQQHVSNKSRDFYLCAFCGSKLESEVPEQRFHDSYFSNTQMHRVVAEILACTVYGKQKQVQMGIACLLAEGICMRPSHRTSHGTVGTSRKTFSSSLKPSLLSSPWGPFDLPEYFGDKVSIYFAWFSVYMAWLLPTAPMGTLVLIYGLVTMGTNTPGGDLCQQWCPRCDTCAMWNISEISAMAKLGKLFHHPGTVFLSIFMSFWATAFLEHWKHRATLAHHWDCSDFQEEEECPHPEFAALAPPDGPEPTDRPKGPSFHPTCLPCLLTGFALILIMLCVVMIFLMSVIIYHGIISITMFHTGNPVLMTQAGNIANINSTVLNLMPILLLGQVYTLLAEQLTKWEMHRTQTLHKDTFTFKVFIFQCVNFYSSPCYVAFFKGSCIQTPHQYGMENKDQGGGTTPGCLQSPSEQLFIITVGKQLVRNVEDFVVLEGVPEAKNVVQRVCAWLPYATQGLHFQSWEEEGELMECEGLFEEYRDGSLQFGFITIFMAAFPQVPFALLNNWVEIKLDAHKFMCCECERQEEGEDMGGREGEMEARDWENRLGNRQMRLGTYNAFLKAFTSDFLAASPVLRGLDEGRALSLPSVWTSLRGVSLRYKAFRDPQGNLILFYWKLLAVRLGFTIAFEHVVFFLHLIAWLLPDVPATLATKIQLKRYLAKQALADNRGAL
uniref:Anoctamin n=1 Tax=Loxodonta africana TaxID=9785 RepID=G3TVU0_LOXAF